MRAAANDKNCKESLSETDVKVATVIGFPFGYSAVEAKIAEIVLAMVDGADELDMVINLLALKNNDWQYLANEITHIMPVVKQKNKIIKIIIESRYFNRCRNYTLLRIIWGSRN